MRRCKIGIFLLAAVLLFVHRPFTAFAGELTDPVLKQVHLGIDSQHIYEGMQEAYAEGYWPKEKDGEIQIVVPFTADGELREESLIVGLSFDDGEHSPFQKKNYQTKVNLQRFSFGEETLDIYYYSMQLPLLEEREGGQYPVRVKAVGYEKKGNEVSLEYTVFCNVSGTKATSGDEQKPEEQEPEEEKPQEQKPEEGEAAEKEEVSHQPKFLLESSSLTDNCLDAGDTKEVEFLFRNRSQKFKACNIKVTVTQENEGIVLQKNSAYFQEAEADGTIKLQVPIQVLQNAVPANVPLQFQLEYDDVKGTSFTANETYTLRVRQRAEASLASVSLPAVVYATDTEQAEIQVVNTGRSEIYNVRVSMKGNGLFPIQSYYGGNLPAGESLQGQISVYVGVRTMENIQDPAEGSDAEKYGEVEGAFTLEYEDSEGQTYSQILSCNTKIQAEKTLNLKVEQKTEVKETNQWWISLLVLSGILLVLFGIVQTLRLRAQRSL